MQLFFWGLFLLIASMYVLPRVLPSLARPAFWISSVMIGLGLVTMFGQGLIERA
jgi:tellurite resistance protein TehA-like permease